MCGNLQCTADSPGEVRKVNGAPELIRYQLTDDTGAKSRSTRRLYTRATALLPVNAKAGLHMSVSTEAPTHEYATGLDGNCAELCRIGSELVEYHGQYLTRFSTQYDIRSVDARIAGSGVGRQLTTHKFRQWDALPTPTAKQLLCMAIDLMRPLSATTNSAIELLICCVRSTTAETVASVFFTRWSSSATSLLWRN